MTDLRDWVLISRLIYETGSHLFETTTDIYRIQCLVAADRDGAVNFAKRFGLRVEGTLHDYAGAGRDYYALAITRATWKEELNGRWNRR